MRRLFLVGCAFVGLLLACDGCKRTRGPNITVVPDEPTGALLQPASGLSVKERQDFYHLTMGSELLPLAWLQALESASTGKPFLDAVDRFGLLADANSPDGLPIGLTAAVSKDSRFAVRMVGFNCAACHVGELHYHGKRVRIDGAPGLFDAEAFTKDLVASLTAMVKSPAKLFAFLGRLSNTGKAASGRTHVHGLLRAFPTLDSLKKAGDLERRLAAHVETMLNEEVKRTTAALEKGLSAQKGTLQELVGQIQAGDLGPVLAGRPGADSPLSKLAGDEREAAVQQWIKHAVETVRLLKARIAFAEKVVAEKKEGLAATEGGPGRVDDFGLARNLIFDATLAGPLTAPCSIPHLWGLARVRWTDWDANTTSSLGRSMATALAAGAVFDPRTFRSTVPPQNLARLDELAIRIQAPPWPETVLGKIDSTKAEQGAALFKVHCLKCHGSAEGPPDGLVALEKIGTDPLRLQNYARKLGHQEFPAALQDAVANYVRQACKDDKIEAEEQKLAGGRPNQWRKTNGYVGRTLSGVWATAPYLHNGSVPTLYHLLLPTRDRPQTFPLGHREYDPVKVGYTTSVEKPLFTFDTTKIGNANSGHEFGVSLPDRERWQLIEYLKTL